jgi:hypothetical protein
MQSKLQHQPYDHVLRESECERDAFEDVAEYIARNPERGNLPMAMQITLTPDASFRGIQN